VFEKYMIVNREFHNVSQGGQTTGFQLKIRINYYRGCYLSMVDTLKLVIDGEEFSTDQMTFSVPEHGPDIPSPQRTFTFDQLAQATDVRWFFGDPATLTINKPGGLKPGLHTVQLGLFIRNSYMPRFDKENLYDFHGGGRGPNGETGYGLPSPNLPLVTRKMTLVQ
jgi:hypothetical protein